MKTSLSTHFCNICNVFVTKEILLLLFSEKIFNICLIYANHGVDG